MLKRLPAWRVDGTGRLVCTEQVWSDFCAGRKIVQGTSMQGSLLKLFKCLSHAYSVTCICIIIYTYSILQ